MCSYGDFAYFYDLLMKDVDYNKKCDFILSLFEKWGKKPTLLLDLACGTGEFSNLMSEKGIEVIGVDMSEDMLSVARQKTAERGNDILYLCQRAEQLDLYGTVDGAICCLDSLNHITNKRAFAKAIERTALFLEKDSLFIFDLNTPYKHKEILANNTFVIEEDDLYLVWQNSFNEKKLTTQISLDFFTRQNDLYGRYSECFEERAYKQEEIAQILQKSGFQILAVYDGETKKSPSKKTERWIYVVKK